MKLIKDVWICIFLLDPFWIRLRLVCKEWNQWICEDERFWGLKREDMKSILNNIIDFDKIEWTKLQSIPKPNHEGFGNNNEHHPYLKVFNNIIIRIEYPSWATRITKVTFYRVSDLEKIKTIEISKVLGGIIPQIFFHNETIYYSSNDELVSRIESLRVKQGNEDPIVYFEGKADDCYELCQFRYPLGLINWKFEADNVYNFEKREFVFKFPYNFGNSVYLFNNRLVSIKPQKRNNTYICTYVPCNETNSDQIIQKIVPLDLARFRRIIIINDDHVLGYDDSMMQIYSLNDHCLITTFIFEKEVYKIQRYMDNFISIVFKCGKELIYLWKRYSKQLVLILDRQYNPNSFIVSLLPFGVIGIVSLLYFN